MMILLQLLKQLNVKQQELFVALFTNWTEEANELGYSSDAELGDFVNDCMFNHLNVTIEDAGQLERLVDVLKRPESVKSALSVVRMR